MLISDQITHVSNNCFQSWNDTKGIFALMNIYWHVIIFIGVPWEKRTANAPDNRSSDGFLFVSKSTKNWTIVSVSFVTNATNVRLRDSSGNRRLFSIFTLRFLFFSSKWTFLWQNLDRLWLYQYQIRFYLIFCHG